MNRASSAGAGVFAGFLIVTVVAGVLIGLPLGWKATKEWRLETDGRAKLAEARNASKVKTEQAKANLESQKLNAMAEVERAKGVAESVRIENGAITDSYTNYLYVKNLGKANVIYVPTEAGLPVLEAGKR